MAHKLLPLPVTISTFRTLRERGYLYVDKTRHAYNLITGSDVRVFLSRPRRFGKSLFVSTLEEILLGNRELCHDLWIGSSDYAWQKHGVIVLDLSMVSTENRQEFREGLCLLLTRIARSYGLSISVEKAAPEAGLAMVVDALYEKFGRVALLIDEYDSPILRNLHTTPHAEMIRDILRSFFGAVKGLDRYLNFVLITGVSSFAKAGLFSGMNNVHVITTEKESADMCGYTEAEVDHYFQEYIQEWADRDGMRYSEQRAKIQSWYNGYSFSKDLVRVYNPFSLMHALKAGEFENFWIRSGAPAFLLDQLQRKQQERPQEFEEIVGSKPLKLDQEELGAFDVGATPLAALLFQTGYLTIADYSNKKYQLGTPNYEVEKALQFYLLSVITRLDTVQTKSATTQLYEALNAQDVALGIEIIKQLFAHIAYPIKPREEKDYHRLLQMALVASGMNAHAEYITSQGRADIIVELPHLTYVIEVKLNVAPEVALAQIEDRAYCERFLKKGKTIILLGVSFIVADNKLEIRHAMKMMPV
jgi:hypothetical protein